MTGTPPTSLEARRARWERLPYPTQQTPPGKVTAGVDWALTAGDLSAVFHDFFEGSLDPSDRTMMRVMLQQLPGAVAALDGDAHHYFSEALEILTAVEELSRDAHLT